MNFDFSKNYYGYMGLLLILMLTTPDFTGQSLDRSTHINREYDPCFIENNSFQAGEEFVYKMYYHLAPFWIPAGELVMKVEDQGDEYHYNVSGRTYKSYEWFYKVRDNYKTWVDKNTLLPNVSIRDIHEGKYQLYDKIQFDQKKNIATSLRGKTKEDAKESVYELEGCMHDLISILYYVRNLDYESMKTGTLIPIEIFIDEEVWPLTVSYDGKEEKRIKGHGKLNTITFSPEVIEGYIFTEKDKMRVWASDDKNRMPLMIESPVSVGSIRAVLSDYKGIKYPEDSVLN